MRMYWLVAAVLIPSALSEAKRRTGGWKEYGKLSK